MNNENPLLAIVVISYNTLEMTLACIESVIKETHRYPYELFVYDNDSKDGSEEAIAKQFPNVNLVASKDNIGFARANNVVIKELNHQYVLLLNPDTVVLDGAIDKLMDFANEYPKAGIWGGKTLFGDLSLNPGSCFKRMTLWNQLCRATGLAAIFRQSAFFNTEDYGGWKRDSIRKVDIVCGCFLLTRSNIWHELGGFNRKYFMYAEEADLCLRAIAKGYQPMITDQAVIIHYGGGSESIRADKMVRLLRAKTTLAFDHWNGNLKWSIRPLLKTWVATRMIAFRVLILLGLEKYRDSYSAWKEIWKRSKEWEFGYMEDK